MNQHFVFSFRTALPRALPHLLSFALLASGTGISCFAQQLPSLQSANSLGADIFTHTQSTGMVLVAVRDNEAYVQTYGQTRPNSRQKPTPDSLVRLCSLSKILATDLLVKLAVDGTVRLDDPLQKFAPAETSPLTPPACRARSPTPPLARPTSPSPTTPSAGNGSPASASARPPALRPTTPTSASTSSAMPWSKLRASRTRPSSPSAPPAP